MRSTLQVVDLRPTRGHGDQVDLATQQLKIRADRRVAVDHSHMTAAEPAQAVAERDVQVDRRRRSRRQRAQPFRIALGAHRAGENSGPWGSCYSAALRGRTWPTGGRVWQTNRSAAKPLSLMPIKPSCYLSYGRRVAILSQVRRLIFVNEVATVDRYSRPAILPTASDPVAHT
jgi:hypothetical protein